MLSISPDQQSQLAAVMPWLASLPAGTDPARAYICEDFTCQIPISDARELETRLARGKERP